MIKKWRYSNLIWSTGFEKEDLYRVYTTIVDRHNATWHGEIEITKDIYDKLNVGWCSDWRTEPLPEWLAGPATE